MNTPLWRNPLPRRGQARPDFLFHNPSDAAQENNLAQSQPEKVADLADLLRQHAQALEVPEEQIARLGL